MLPKLKTYYLQKTTKLLLVLKRWALPILLIYVTALTIGSLSRVSAVPKLGFSFDDKIYHFIAYGLLTFLLYNYLKGLTIKAVLRWSAVIAIIYGIIIEGLQSVLTDFRTPDYYDGIANTFGAFVTALILEIKSKRKIN